MTGRMFLRHLVFVAVLYVLVSMTAALARLPGYQSVGGDVYRQDAIDATVTDAVAVDTSPSASVIVYVKLSGPW